MPVQSPKQLEQREAAVLAAAKRDGREAELATRRADLYSSMRLCGEEDWGKIRAETLKQLEKEFGPIPDVVVVGVPGESGERPVRRGPGRPPGARRAADPAVAPAFGSQLSAKVLAELRAKGEVPIAAAAVWVFERLGDHEVQPLDAPSLGTWNFLMWARQNEEKFYLKYALGQQAQKPSVKVDEDAGSDGDLLEILKRRIGIGDQA